MNNMKKLILNTAITLLIMMNICVGVMIYAGMKPKCFVDGCNCARIKNEHYCSKHLKVNEICLNVRNRN